MRVLLTGVCFLCLLATAPASERILLVQGTTSTPNAAERNYAKSVTRRLSRLLTDMAIPHSIRRDEAISAKTLAGVRVAILGYNPNPPAAELSALRTFVSNGGRLVVFYSSSSELATMLGLQLGRYAVDKRGTRWNTIRFTRNAPPHMPASVRQESRNIRPALPLSKDARIIARWEPPAGHPTGDIAWVRSSRGAWMSHILRDDGDEENKKQMLLSVLGSFDPSVWEAAAREYLHEAETIGNYRDFDETVRTILLTAQPTTAAPRVRRLLIGAHRKRNTILNHIQAGRYSASVPISRELARQLIQAYAAAHPDLLNGLSRRGVWEHAGRGPYPGDWDRTCRELTSLDITDLFPNMLWAGIAHFDSKVVDHSDTFKLLGDQLQQCVTAAKTHGLRVHLWVVCWRLDHALPEFVERMRKEGRLQVNDAGKPRNWLCPSRADNVAHHVAAIRDAVQRYPVDGVHLDYVRYQDSHVCFCESCRLGFERAVGKPVVGWPQAASTGAFKQAYSEWRCGRITHFVREIRAALKAVNPTLELSAAVFGKYPSCVASVAQDWPVWVKQGIVDFVCPMNYTTDLQTFSEFTQQQFSLVRPKRCYPGLGVTAQESRLNTVQVVDQLKTARRLGATGFLLYELNATLLQDILPLLPRKRKEVDR